MTKAVVGRWPLGVPRGALPAMRRRIALIGETFGQAARQLLRGVLKILVIAFGFPGEQDMHAMMPVIRPLRVVFLVFGFGVEQRGVVVFVFQDQMDVAAGDALRGCSAAISVRNSASPMACTASKRRPSKR